LPATSENSQQRVQRGELAAFALVAHPDFFLRIPAPRTVEEEEAVVERAIAAVAIAVAIFGVELVDPQPRELQQRVVLGKRLVAGVAKIGEQGKMQALIAIAEKAHFERLDQALDSRRARQHRRHDDERARVRRYAFGKIHSG